MNQLKIQVVQKLNAIVELVRHCATKVVTTQDHTLMQEVTLAAITHEGLIKLFEQNGPTENVVGLVNDFGKAVADLYHNISTFKLTPPNPLKMTQFTAKRPDKNLLN